MRLQEQIQVVQDRQCRRSGAGTSLRRQLGDGGLQPAQHRRELAMFVLQTRALTRRQMKAAGAQRTDAQHAQRVDDHRHIDELLHHGAIQRRQPAKRGQRHRQQGQPHPGNHALQGDAAAVTGDVQGFGQSVEAIGQQDDVGRFGRSRGAACAHGHPHAGCRQRRRVIHAIAHHHRRPVHAGGFDGRQFVGGCLSGAQLINPQTGSDGFGDSAAISRQHDDAADAGTAQQAQGARRFLAQLVGQQQAAGIASIQRHHHRRAAHLRAARQQLMCVCRQGGEAGDIILRAHGDGLAIHLAAQARSGQLADGVCSAECQPARLRRRDHGGRHDMLGVLLQRGGEPEQLVIRHQSGILDGDQLRLPAGERARLVEKHGLRARQRFQRRAALDQDAALGAARNGRNDGHRHGQDQRTRRGHHHHGQGA